MSNNRKMVLAAIGVTIVMTIIGMLVIWPNYRQAAAIRRQTVDLRAKVAAMGDQQRAVEELQLQVAQAQERMNNELKIIPETADLARLIRKLSQDVDRVRVLDQTFTAGTQAEAIIGGKSTVQAMPLTVEMDSTFDSVFALIQNAESMDRLVRVSSVRVGCKRDKEAVGAPIVEATVTLEAIFDPPAASGVN